MLCENSFTLSQTSKRTNTTDRLNKGNWNCIIWKNFIPVFIDYCPSKELYITTNIFNEHSGKALRIHKLMALLAEQGVVNKVYDTVLYYTNQTVWRLNVQEYVKRRSIH